MRSVTLKSFACGLFAVGVSMFTQSAQANPALPVPTGILNFLTYTGSAPKGAFSSVDPVGWTGGNGLIFIDTPGTGPNGSGPESACGPVYLTTYGCPGNLAIPGGYNYVEADGNPTFESGFNYTVSGLTPGTTYTLSFYQGASQQTGFGNGLHTTEQWIVGLGGAGFTKCDGCGALDPYYGSNQSTYSDAGASVAATSLMTTPSGGVTPWNFVSVNLTADSTSDLLSFLAWGNDGTTANLPPIVFLTGVNSPAGLTSPEPASLVLFGSALLGIGVAVRRRRAAKV